MTSFYEQEMLRLFEKYELSDNARTMFKALDEFKTARLDEDALGRLIRLSPNNREALVNTMVKCASIMKDKPKESKYCLSIITSCGDMLRIADRPSQAAGFPGFIKLPLEIRHRIYKIYLGNYKGAPNIIPFPKRGECLCAPHEPPACERFREVNMQLARTCKRISNEFLGYFYRRRTFYFPCTCEMEHHLTNNMLLHSAIRHVMFHWCGERADYGIARLHGMKQLETMCVVISRATSRILTAREQELRHFFGAKRNSQISLPESLGWEELMDIRGLKSVTVLHTHKRKADRRTDDERKSLENILASYVLGPEEDEE